MAPSSDPCLFSRARAIVDGGQKPERMKQPRKLEIRVLTPVSRRRLAQPGSIFHLYTKYGGYTPVFYLVRPVQACNGMYMYSYVPLVPA